MKRPRLTYRLLCMLLMLAVPLGTAAQNDKKIADQRKVIADLERQIANEEKNISKLKNDKSSNEEKIRRLSKQIENRNDLLLANERQSQLLQNDVNRADSTARALSTQLDDRKARYIEMVRESYRNYRHDNYISFIFSAENFTALARRIAVLREVAVKRGERIDEIRTLSAQVADEQAELARRQSSLDSVKRKINSEKAKMQTDVKNARTAVKQLTTREKQALQKKSALQKKHTLAREELARLTKGNKVGESFSKKSKIDLPVDGGTRGRIVGDICEIMGKPNARVNSVYDGKVIAVKSTGNRYEVYIAHGERVSSYSNLAEVVVKQGQTVSRNQRIGTIGSWVNPLKSEPEYKILFQLQSPTGNESYSLATMFSK